MATREVRLEFVPVSTEGFEQWNTPSELPEDYFGPLSLQETPAHRARITPGVRSIVAAHQTECDTKVATSLLTCKRCKKKAINALLVPVSFLHITAADEDETGPRIRVYVVPLCKDPECRRLTIALNAEIMDGILAAQKQQLVNGKQCPCGVSVGTMACAKCKVACYCGREHQRLDYKNYRKMCDSLRKMRKMTEGQQLWYREGGKQETSSSSKKSSTKNPSLTQSNPPSASSSSSSKTKPKSCTTNPPPTQSTPPKKSKSKSKSEPTREVRIHCAPISESPAWDTTAKVPTSLIGQFTQPPTASYQATFNATMGPIVAALQPDFNTRSGPICLVCQIAPTTFGVSFCMSQLQAPEPFVLIGIVPTCGSRQCKERAHEMNKTFQREQGTRDAGNACRVCGKYEGARKCMRCRTVSYCGQEHQRQDWPAHKRECGQLATTNG